MRSDITKLRWCELYAQGALLAISATVVAVWVFTKPIVFTYDTFTYIDVAQALKVGDSANADYLRLPVFPLILLSFQVTDLAHSVQKLIAFHSVFAVASCWLFYLTARQCAPRGAFILSLVFVASLLPFVQVKHIMTEQTFFFETMVTLYGITVYLMARTHQQALSAILIAGAGTALMMLTRPQGAYVAPVVFGTLAVLVWRRAWVAAIGAILVVGALWSIQFVDQRVRLGFQQSGGRLDNSYSTGKMLLFTFYLDGSARANIRISPENGPATAELKALLLDEFAKPDTLARRKGYLASVPPEEVPVYVQKIFDAPSSEFWVLLSFASLDERLGLREANQLLVRVCLEAAMAYPMETLRLFISKGLKIYWDPEMLAVPVHPEFPVGTFHPPLSDEMSKAGDYTNPTSIDRQIDYYIRCLMRIAILVALITLPVALRYPTWRVTLALLIFGLYLNFAVVVGVSPLFRYAIYAIPVNLICAYTGTVALLSFLRERYLKKPVVVDS